jgi:hypothetical protein
MSFILGIIQNIQIHFVDNRQEILKGLRVKVTYTHHCIINWQLFKAISNHKEAQVR